MKPHISPKEFGQAVGVSESSVKRWIDLGLIAAGRTGGGHRRIEVSEAVRYIRENQLKLTAPELLGLLDVAATPAEARHLDHAGAVLSHALQAGLAPQVRGTLTALFLAGHSVASIADGPVARTMHEIGELWKKSKAGIFVEHRATQLCATAIYQVQALLPPPAEDAPVAIGAAPADDPYLIPTLLASVTLAADGWRTVNLGPQTPMDVLAIAGRDLRPRLYWLSFTSPLPEATVYEEVRSLCSSVADQSAHVIVGGQKIPWPFTLSLPRLRGARTMAELSAFAGGLREASKDRQAGAAQTAQESHHREHREEN